LPFTINPLGDAHDFCKANSAFTRSKNRRRKRHKEKIHDVSYMYKEEEMIKLGQYMLWEDAVK